MNTSTYNRLTSTVSATRKSQAVIACAWAAREPPPGRPGPPRCGIDAGGVQDLPTVDAAITYPSRARSLRVLPRHPHDQRLDRNAGRWPSWPAPVGVGATFGKPGDGASAGSWPGRPGRPPTNGGDEPTGTTPNARAGRCDPSVAGLRPDDAAPGSRDATRATRRPGQI